jgi:hypothetical protein
MCCLYEGVWPGPVARPLLSISRGGLRLSAVACLAVALADVCGCVWSPSRAGVSCVACICLCLAFALRLSAPVLLGVSLVPLCNYSIQAPGSDVFNETYVDSVTTTILRRVDSLACPCRPSCLEACPRKRRRRLSGDAMCSRRVLCLAVPASVAELLGGSEPALAEPLDRGELAPLTSASHYWRRSVSCCGFCVGVTSVPSGARARDAGACRWAAWTIGAAPSGLLGHGDVAP